MINRCQWANSSEWLKKYHDEEWGGKPFHNDQKLFEMLILEGKSCGLSWELILKKRDHMKKVFDNFDPEILIKYDEIKIQSLMSDAGIIRNKLKISAVIENAKAYLRLKERQTFDDFLWKYVNYEPIVNDGSQRIARNKISDRLSKDLKKSGFKFVGSIIIYSFMQAIGMVNDHENMCFCKFRSPQSHNIKN
ncbi:MAG: DNA-3-methyladenine glycosylase I [Holosporaceae bacterium]|jgi:DNA-3-methyladenine glycosylase I|nr:DNA-3-methyladenine glycosylase I [Holosporaceae bacterium]